MASKITKIVANFETQLGSTLAVSAVTGSLKSPVVDDDGVTLPDGKYVMTVDLGNAKEEHILFDLIGSTGVISNIKSVSRQGVETTGCVRQHRSGAKVTLTNFANLLYISKILTGEVPFDGANPLVYDIAPTFSNALQIVTKGYVDGIAIAGGVDANKTAKGITTTTKNQGTKSRVKSVLVREQATPNKTLLVESFRINFIDKVVAYAGGNTPNFIDPALGGDFAFALQPANGETITVTVDGVATVCTFVTSIGANPANILIGGTVAQTRANFVNFINNPSVTNANQVAVTGTNLTAIQKLSATDDASLNAFIRVTNTSTTTFSVTESLAGAGNIWTANTTKHRYDVVVIDNAGSLAIRKGTEAVSPTVPTLTSGDLALALIFNRVNQTKITDVDNATDGYIAEWYEPSIYRTDIALSSQIPAVTENYILGESFTGATTPQPARIVNDVLQTIFDGETSYGASGTNQVATKIKPQKTVTVSSIVATLMRPTTDPSVNMTIEIQTDNAGVPSNTPVTNGTSNAIATSGMTTNEYKYFNFTFSTPPVLQAGVTYHIVFKTSATNVNQISVPTLSNASKYADFSGAVYNGTTWSANQPSPIFEIIPTAGGSMSLWRSDGNGSVGIRGFDGFVVTTGSAGAVGTIYRKGIVTGFNSLAENSEYFVSNTVGTLTLNKNEGMTVGIAVSSTQIRINESRTFERIGYLASFKQSSPSFLRFSTIPVYAYEDGFITFSSTATSYNSTGQQVLGWVMNTHANNTSPFSIGITMGYHGFSGTISAVYGQQIIPVKKGDRVQFVQDNNQGGGGSAPSGLVLHFTPRI